MNETTAYRIVEIRNGKPATLFHGISGSRNIPLGTWVKADNRMVRDGTGPWYEGGFNVLLDREACEAYLERFKKPRELKVVEIKVRGRLRPKAHSPSPVFLADWMYLPEQEINR